MSVSISCLIDGKAPSSNEKWPKISIITPSFNQAEFLEATIKSVLDQAYPHLEYIVIDGGSTDGSIDIIQKYAHRLTYWCSEPDAGQYDAINKGMKRATGDVLAWINSDDIYLPWTLYIVASIMRACPDVRWLTSATPIAIDRSGFPTWVGSLKGFSSISFREGRHDTIARHSLGFIPQESTFWRKSLWVDSGEYVPTENGDAGDFGLWGRFFQLAPLHCVSSPLGCYRRQDNQKTQNIAKYLSDTKAIRHSARSGALNRYVQLVRDIIYRTRLRDLPIVRGALRTVLGYEAYYVERTAPETTDASWVVRRGPFL